MSRLALSRLLGALVLFAACLFGIQSCVSSDPQMVNNTIRSNQALNVDFAAAATLVDAFYSRHERFPTATDPPSVDPDTRFVLLHGPVRNAEDLKAIPSGAQIASFEINSAVATFPAQARSEFPPAPANAQHPYLLIDHSTDKPVIWASWVRRSDAVTDPKRFYFLGSSGADTLLFGVVGGVLAVVGLLLLKGPGTRKVPAVKTPSAETPAPKALPPQAPYPPTAPPRQSPPKEPPHRQG